MTTLQERIEAGEVILIDGAMATELDRRGVPMHDTAWSGSAVVTHPDIVREAHADYIRAGAEVIITNTFGMARHVLETAGYGDRVAALNRRATELAREAIEQTAGDRKVWIAGSISSMSGRGEDRIRPGTDVIAANYREQVGALAAAGCDLFILEMMKDVDHSIAAVEAATATGLPVWVGFSCRLADHGAGVLMWSTDEDRPFADAIGPVMQAGGSVAIVMHSLIDVAGPALEDLFANWSGPVGAYPHVGEFAIPSWQFVDIPSPEAYAEVVLGWVRRGVQIVGGCCGLGPEHIRALRDRLPTHLPNVS